MNINELNRIKTINVEAPIADIQPGSGTFKDILDKVYDNTIIPLVNNAGTIIGISYDSKTTDLVQDGIEEMKFQRAYSGKPVQDYCLEALKLKAVGAVVTEVMEDGEAISVKFANGEIEQLLPRLEDLYARYGIEEEDLDWEDEEDCDDEGYSVNRNTLPVDVTIQYEELPDISEKSILNYLRNRYGHYLSGKHPKPTIIYNSEELFVSNISWGRKR